MSEKIHSASFGRLKSKSRPSSINLDSVNIFRTSSLTGRGEPTQWEETDTPFSMFPQHEKLSQNVEDDLATLKLGIKLPRKDDHAIILVRPGRNNKSLKAGILVVRQPSKPKKI
mmetsp:Transcript_55316/g.75582  ORF Transcript_55316/g.75582 Transcript_55316/m.75582 type:complete len:114 (-) Transcript_55316:496-837(-)